MYLANPTVIEMPMVKFLNEPINTPCRSFPLGAVIQFTCEGYVGSDPDNVCTDTLLPSVSWAGINMYAFLWKCQKLVFYDYRQ